MGSQKKGIRIGITFIVLLLVAGLALMYTGNDAVLLGMEKKEGILTAEQVKVSFDSVSGRLVKEAVQEAQEVKKGDILMELDSTDVDLSIAKLKAQIAQMDAQIASMGGTIKIGYAQANTSEVQSLRQIDEQRAAVSVASATLENKKLDYNRKQSLVAAGAISQSEMDDAATSLDVARNNLRQQQETLQRLLGGAYDTGDTNSLSLPTIANQRMQVANQSNDLAALEAQRQQLEVQLQELEVQKERLTLRAPEDGKVLKIIAKEGEMISPNTPVILLESKRCYFDLYLSEEQIGHLHEGDTITGHTVAGDIEVPGTIRLVTQAPGFADLKNSREKGQADLSAFQVRIYTEPTEGVQTGMTIGVDIE